MSYEAHGVMLPGTGAPPDVAGPCPFCLVGRIEVWWNDPPRVPGVFVHTLPECDRFRALPADEFVAAVARGEHKQ